MQKTLTLMIAALVLTCSAALADDDAQMVPNRLATAQVGEWASYQLQSGYIQKHTVTKRDGSGPDAMVTVLVENYYDDELVDSREITQEAGEPMHLAEAPEGSEIDVDIETMTILGRSMQVWSIEIDYDDDKDVEWYISPDVPVFGLIKQESDRGEDYVLVDYSGR